MSQSLNHQEIIREHHLIDATGRIAGRLAAEVAILLMGKHKVDYQPNADLGDYVEIANIRQIKFSGKKLEQKSYYRASGYPGGLKATLLKKFFKEQPEKLFLNIIKNMLPHNRLRAERLKRLTFKK